MSFFEGFFKEAVDTQLTSREVNSWEPDVCALQSRLWDSMDKWQTQYTMWKPNDL